MAIRKADVLVERTWHVGIQNTSTDAITGLRVNVTARDGSGTAVNGGCQRAPAEARGSVGDAAAAAIVRNNQVIMKRVREDFDEFVQHAAKTYESYGVGDAELMLQAFSAGMANLDLSDSAAAVLKEQVKQSIALQIGDDWPSRLAPGESAIVAYQTDQADYTVATEIFFTDVSGYIWRRDETRLERISEPDLNPEGVATQSEPARERKWWNPLRRFGHKKASGD